MFCRGKAFPEPRLRHKGVYGIGIREENRLGQDADLDYSRVEIAGESGGRREEAYGFGGGVD